MKLWMICLVLISMVVMARADEEESKPIEFLNCNQPKPPPASLEIIHRRFPRPPLHDDRGCNAITRCRGGIGSGRPPPHIWLPFCRSCKGKVNGNCIYVSSRSYYLIIIYFIIMSFTSLFGIFLFFLFYI